MIPAAFEYYRPKDMDGVLAILQEHGDDARVMAGGHSLIPMMKLRMADIPHLIDLQGVVSEGCTQVPMTAENGGERRDPLTREPITEEQCGQLVLEENSGSMSPAQYDAAVYDLVNFLAYTAEPMAAERQRTGIFVLLFIALFFVFAWLLNREYWKDVH